MFDYFFLFAFPNSEAMNNAVLIFMDVNYLREMFAVPGGLRNDDRISPPFFR